jgi:hypothetical protein
MAVATVWVAPVGTAFPATNASPGGSWFELGTAGNKNYDEPGVVVTNSQSIASWKPAGGTAPRKVARTDEGMLCELTVVDMTVEQYAKIINNATVTTTAGPPATKSFSLMQGITVQQFAVLIRSIDAYGASLNQQFQINAGYNASSPKLAFQKDKPVGIDVQLTGLDDGSGSPWTFVAQTA